MEPRVPEFPMASALRVRRRDRQLSAVPEPPACRRKDPNGIDHMLDHVVHRDDSERFLRDIGLLDRSLHDVEAPAPGNPSGHRIGLQAAHPPTEGVHDFEVGPVPAADIEEFASDRATDGTDDLGTLVPDGGHEAADQHPDPSFRPALAIPRYPRASRTPRDAVSQNPSPTNGRRGVSPWLKYDVYNFPISPASGCGSNHRWPHVAQRRRLQLPGASQ